MMPISHGCNYVKSSLGRVQLNVQTSKAYQMMHPVALFWRHSSIYHACKVYGYPPCSQRMRGVNCFPVLCEQIHVLRRLELIELLSQSRQKNAHRGPSPFRWRDQGTSFQNTPFPTNSRSTFRRNPRSTTNSLTRLSLRLPPPSARWFAHISLVDMFPEITNRTLPESRPCCSSPSERGGSRRKKWSCWSSTRCCSEEGTKRVCLIRRAGSPEDQAATRWACSRRLQWARI